ncbi:MAG: UDP-N-acetylmuramoyl-L-alanyl-D-glutamate--2,6-diaminopimelate ligase [Peptoniphilaceae bacterium]|nr:UDP-N-acetylmuramoyl-L-alanyl-D-glutamate--2,6-diaminopimelate ligase [Peptoniphilaceae bacterium]
METRTILELKEHLKTHVIAATGPLETPIEAISYDSRTVVPGTLFFCKGRHFKAEYLQTAFQKGAVGYVAEKEYDGDVPHLIVDDMRAVLAPAARFFYGDPQRALQLLAITGTKGKSSTAWYLHHILSYEAEKPVGLLSSIQTDDGLTQEPSILTTPEPFELQALLARCVAHGVEQVVMEVSSQALKVGRTAGLHFDQGAFLNISPDHLSPIEHPDFEDYLQSKLRLFSQTETAFVHVKSDHLDEVFAAARRAKRVITVGPVGSDAESTYEILREAPSMAFRLHYGHHDFAVEMAEIAAFSVENAAMAATMALEAGASDAAVQGALRDLGVPGRMQELRSTDGRVTVIVDYAHNKLSFESLFRAVHARYPEAKVAAVFGSAGGKSYNRRLDMASVVDREADFVVLTNEDPHEEDVMQPIRDIAAGLSRVPYTMEVDRARAIRLAFDWAYAPEQKGGPVVLLLLGKGEEQMIYFADENVPYAGDAAIAEGCLAERGR